uniref:Si:ch1073-126c3.2 n=1 Tax=Pundamilia nyererei TaxID=303518 RepID=A0A3B4G2H5_9CICH
MALKATLTWLCSLAVLSSCVAHETIPLNCSSQAELWERLSADLSVAVECGENPPSSWTAQQTAALELYMRNLTDTLHKHQLKECQGSEPTQCKEAEVPKNGGLACATVANKRYCKPMCNYGYDFGFLRKRRVFDECSGQTGYQWQSQYVGGNKLAECIEASIQGSGATTAYFPKDQDCITTKSSSQMQNRILEDFTAELKGKGIQGELKYACLVCG